MPSGRSICKAKRSLQPLSTNASPISTQKCEAAQSLSDKLDAQLEDLQAQLDAHLKVAPLQTNLLQPSEPVYFHPKDPLVLPNGMVLWPMDDAVGEGSVDEEGTDSEDAEEAEERARLQQMSVDELEDEIDEMNDCLRECDYEPWELIKKNGNKDDLIRRLRSHANGRIEEGSANEDDTSEDDAQDYWHEDEEDSDTDTESASNEHDEEDQREDEDDEEQDCLNSSATDDPSAQQHADPHSEVKRLTGQIAELEGELTENHSSGNSCKTTRKELRYRLGCFHRARAGSFLAAHSEDSVETQALAKMAQLDAVLALHYHSDRNPDALALRGMASLIRGNMLGVLADVPAALQQDDKRWQREHIKVGAKRIMQMFGELVSPGTWSTVCMDDASPCARYYAAYVTHGSDLYMFGGKGRCLVSKANELNREQQAEVDRFLQENANVQRRCKQLELSPSAIYKAIHQESVNHQTQGSLLADLWHLDLSKQTLEWELLGQTGELPLAREQAVMWYHEGRLYLHGGKGAGECAYGTTHIYEIKEQQWHKVLNKKKKKKKKMQPAGRFGHCAFVHKCDQVTYAYMWGGQVSRADNCLWRFNLDTDSWTEVGYNASDPSLKVDGMTPIECRSECSWWVDSSTDSLLVTGGNEDNVFIEPGTSPCGVWQCCLSTGKWTFEKGSKGLLLPVAETACCTGTCFPHADTVCHPDVPLSFIRGSGAFNWLFGGWWDGWHDQIPLDDSNGTATVRPLNARYFNQLLRCTNKTKQWQLICTSGNEPCGRAGAVIAPMPNDSGVFVFGGYTTLNIVGDGFLPLPQVLADMHVCTVEATAAEPPAPPEDEQKHVYHKLNHESYYEACFQYVRRHPEERERIAFLAFYGHSKLGPGALVYRRDHCASPCLPSDLIAAVEYCTVKQLEEAIPSYWHEHPDETRDPLGILLRELNFSSQFCLVLIPSNKELAHSGHHPGLSKWFTLALTPLHTPAVINYGPQHTESVVSERNRQAEQMLAANCVADLYTETMDDYEQELFRIKQMYKSCASPVCCKMQKVHNPSHRVMLLEQGAEFIDTKLSKCGGCEKVFFCSKSCQKLHWKSGHKAECSRLAQQACNSIQ